MLQLICTICIRLEILFLVYIAYIYNTTNTHYKDLKMYSPLNFLISALNHCVNATNTDPSLKPYKKHYSLCKSIKIHLDSLT